MVVSCCNLPSECCLGVVVKCECHYAVAKVFQVVVILLLGCCWKL